MKPTIVTRPILDWLESEQKRRANRCKVVSSQPEERWKPLSGSDCRLLILSDITQALLTGELATHRETRSWNRQSDALLFAKIIFFFKSYKIKRSLSHGGGSFRQHRDWWPILWIQVLKRSRKTNLLAKDQGQGYKMEKRLLMVRKSWLFREKKKSTSHVSTAAVRSDSNELYDSNYNRHTPLCVNISCFPPPRHITGKTGQAPNQSLAGNICDSEVNVCQQTGETEEQGTTDYSIETWYWIAYSAILKRQRPRN